MTAGHRHPHIVGFGEAILDYVWQPTHDGGEIVGARGGGSVTNILANLAALGWDSAFHGVAGDDAEGHYAVADLAQVGVDITEVEFVPNRRTRLIFESLAANTNHQVGGSAHSFTTRCPVCGQRIPERQRPKLVAALSPTGAGAVRQWSIYDQLTRARLEHAEHSRAAGTKTVLDLGAVSYLRYQPTAIILSNLRRFDLVFLNQQVAASLIRRLGVTAEAVSTLLPETILVTTQGAHGAVVSDAHGFSRRIAAPLVKNLVDDAGAGDALCSFTLNELASGRGQFGAAAVAAAVQTAQSLLSTVLGTVGARGHLPPPAPHAWFDVIRGQTLTELRSQSQRTGHCGLCRLPPAAPAPKSTSTNIDQARNRSARPGARRNTSLMLQRMLAAAEHPTAAAQAAAVLEDSGTVHVVGSGGSLPSATAICGLLNAFDHFATALTPGEYLADRVRADTVIAVSYSGATSDIGAVIRAAKDRGVGRIILVTTARRPPLESELRALSTDMVMSYAPGERSRTRNDTTGVRERGFVSIAGTLAPCMPWLAAASGRRTVVDLVERLRDGAQPALRAAKKLAHSSASACRLNVIYGPGALPAARDIESKFTESGLPPVTVHEQKDLSHGRFVTVLQPPRFSGAADLLSGDYSPPPTLVIATGERSKYQQAMLDALLQAGVPYADIRSTTSDLAGPIELLALVQFFSEAVGSELGIDISRPTHIPEAGLRLYRWRGPLF